MIYLPEKDLELPKLDLLSLIFDSPLSWAEEDTILHAEAAQPSNAITKAQTRSLTKRLSATFRHTFGVGRDGPGKDVVICMSSASYSFTTPELVRQIRQGEANLLVVSDDCRNVALEAAKECGIPPERVLILTSIGKTRSLTDSTSSVKNYLDDSRELEWQRVTDQKILEDTLICLLYSSGTTGPPKGINLSHSMVIASAFIPTMQDREYFAKRRRADPSYKFQYGTIAHLPTAHIAGVQGYFVNPALSGGTVHWMPKFDFPTFCEYNKKFKVTVFFTVPPIYLLIAKGPIVKDHFMHLEQAICGAAPLGPELQALAEKKLGCKIGQTWGLSETTGSITRMPWEQHDASGGISPLLPYTRMRLVDDDERDVEEGSPGELLVKGPSVTKSYYHNEKSTRESFTQDGWFRTGDIGRRQNGKFYIVDRKKELIKYKGIQVAPAELEAHLLSNDLILDAAVIGVADPDGSENELPRAYVVADKTKISEQAIKDFVKSHLASHKQLRGGVVYLDAIPKSASGKILRRDLRELAKKEAKRTQAKL